MDVRRVLIVDDDAFQLLTLSRRLGALGIAADSAPGLREAMDHLARCRYDVVLLDLSLGEADGVSLFRAVRDSRSDPALVIISGLEDRVRTASLRLAHAQGVRVAGALRKPVTQDDLRRVLQQADPGRADASPIVTAWTPGADDLTRAIAAEEIQVHFQPKVALATGAVVGVEALARWPAPDGSMVSPDLFIPIAERNGLIIPLTARVLTLGLQACRRWRPDHPDCSVAINISPAVLADPGLPEQVEALLHHSGLGPGALIIEITENTVIANPLIAAEVLTRLRIKGVNVAIDDFGTGHSSLLSLLRLPFSELKIDKSFVSRCDVDAEAWKITRATISMARELGLTVVAEGVETQAIADRLRDAGCHVGQGWLFARAMDEDALHAWLGRRAGHAV